MRIVFFGTGAIGVPVLRGLRQWPGSELVGIVTQPDKPSGRAQRLTPSPVKAAAAGIPLQQPVRIKESTAEIAAWQPEVIVVMAYGQILPRSVLSIPRIACLNLHASLLPRWRGAAPIQAAIAAGDTQSGITVIYMDAGLDTGDILLSRSISISTSETGATLHDRLAEIAPSALRDALALLSQGDAPRHRQDPAGVTAAPKLQREDGRIDWEENADVIERKIRAYDPWPGAFTCVATGDRIPQPLKIFRAQVVSESGRAGSILHVDGRIVIAAREGALELKEVQLAGKRRLDTVTFTRGLPGPLRLAN